MGVPVNEDVEQFVSGVPEDSRPLFNRIRALIERLYPEASLSLWYGVPTFKTKSGWVSLGYWKEGVSLHSNGAHNIAAFKVAHPRIKTGTGTINLRMSDEVPEESLAQVIRTAMEGVRNTG
jgi:uncharacterized protein YdhG (YjbR/CyaY superfamily)